MRRIYDVKHILIGRHYINFYKSGRFAFYKVKLDFGHDGVFLVDKYSHTTKMNIGYSLMKRKMKTFRIHNNNTVKKLEKLLYG